MRTVIFDLETVPDPDVPFESAPKMVSYQEVYVPHGPDTVFARNEERLLYDARPFPPPPCHKIAVIGYAAFDGYTITHLRCSGGDSEEELLSKFLPYAFAPKSRLVSWNGRGFDVPVLVVRGMKYGLDLSEYYKSRNRAYRYAHPDCIDGHVDLMDRLTDFGAGPRVKLEQVAKMIGLPGKPEGTDGSKVEDMISSGRLNDVRAYCVTDVFQLAVMWLRWELVRGALALSDYRIAVTQTLDMMRQQEAAGLAPAGYLAKTDLDKVMLPGWRSVVAATTLGDAAPDEQVPSPEERISLRADDVGLLGGGGEKQAAAQAPQCAPKHEDAACDPVPVGVQRLRGTHGGAAVPVVRGVPGPDGAAEWVGGLERD